METTNKNVITLSELSKYLDAFLNSATIDEYAYNGVQVANSIPITKIATAVSSSLETIEKTLPLGAQALIVHHGIFVKDSSHTITGTNYRKIKMLIENNIALLCFHLPLDAHREVGNNWKAARDLGLYDLKPFAEYSSISIGVIGSIKAIPFDEFKKNVEHYYGYQAQAVKVKDPIRSVAIISGGADSFITQAAHAGADCFITGRVDEPVWDNAHEENISFLSLGHYGTETIGPKALAGHLQEKFDIPCTFIKTANPF